MTARMATRWHVTPGLSAAIGNAVAAVALGARQLAVDLKHRHELERLVDCDDRMLADIGLTRADLRNAWSEPLWRDPTTALENRRAELRAGRHCRALKAAAQLRTS
jgi:uncharacterized protein YjiS (DUF1127 family)